jgi:hypothetical protein
MANGKEPRTTGEHIVALYGHITGVKKDMYVFKISLYHEEDEVHKKVEKIHGK